ncbi:MAG TPA: SDR family oxidoreductase [Thermoleophilaceae bacterium]|jgi:short-subunit dehydrogenase
MDLTGKRALVTGATGGLGQTIARALHAGGATVVLSGRRAELLEQTVSELGERAEALPADLASDDDVRGLGERAGAVDVLVANAGLPGSGELLEYTPEQIDRVIDVNLRSAIHQTRALLPAMLERGSGHLIYISSISGKVASPAASLYNATKFGLRGFSLAMHEELLGTGVGCTTIFPGFISDAGMWADTDLKPPPGAGTRTPQDVADAVMKALRKNPREIDVASVMLRSGGWFNGFAPGLVAAIQRSGGGGEVSTGLAEAQKSKR